VNPAFKSQGTYVGCFYNQPPSAPTNLLFNETMPAAGVTLLENAVTPTAVRYLAADATIDPSLTATSAARGCAITVGTGNVNQYSGSGGPASSWELQPGGTAANAVFITRFHSCDQAPAGTSTCP
jgi:hypothetical protein